MTLWQFCCWRLTLFLGCLSRSGPSILASARAPSDHHRLTKCRLSAFQLKLCRLEYTRAAPRIHARSASNTRKEIHPPKPAVHTAPANLVLSTPNFQACVKENTAWLKTLNESRDRYLLRKGQNTVFRNDNAAKKVLENQSKDKCDGKREANAMRRKPKDLDRPRYFRSASPES